MARKFFNKKVGKSNKRIIQIVIISISVVGIVICFLIANHFLKNKNQKNAKISLRDMVAMEINDKYPDKTVFFSELENVEEKDITISFENADASKIGKYDIIIKVYNKEYKTTLQVLDTIAPTLEVSDVTIDTSNSYELKDFIKSCTDNSKEECNITFNNNESNDYSAYKEPGEYQIQIKAQDSSGNSTVKTAKLTINKEDGKPITNTSCKYGTSAYDTDKYILATDVTQSGCARDLNLYQSDTLLNSVNEIIKNESNKLKKEFSKLNVTGTISLYENTEPILNKTGNGVVGYAIHMDVLINEETVESFYLDLTGKRIYSLNKYNLP